MTIFCNFHPTQPAHFHCHKCGFAFCPTCIVRRSVTRHSETENHYFCPACNIQAEHIGVGNLIEPFWSRMPKIFGYPFQLHPLLLNIALAILVSFFPESTLVRLAFFVIATKYAYAILATTAKGSVKAPDITFQLINQDVEQVFKQYGVFIIIGVMTGFLFRLAGPVGGFIFLLLVSIFAPAILMMLVVTNSVLAAINPFKFVPIATRIGRHYFLMYLFIFFLYSAPAVLFNFIPLSVPVFITTFVIVFFQQFYTFIIYHLLGYILLQYHEEIGYQVDYEFFLQQSKPDDFKEESDREKLLNQLDILVKSGNHEAAIKYLLRETDGKFDDVDLSEQFLILLKMAQNSAGLEKHAKDHLALLTQKDKITKAIATYTDYFSGNNNMAPPPDCLIKIAKWLDDRGQFQKAIDCYVSFINFFKKHPELPEVYFSLAKILHEKTNNTSKAREIFQSLLLTYPDHELVPQIKPYLATTKDQN